MSWIVFCLGRSRSTTREYFAAISSMSLWLAICSVFRLELAHWGRTLARWTVRVSGAIVLAAFALACASPEEGDADLDTDTDTDSDVDSDTDADTDSDSDTDTTPVCGPALELNCDELLPAGLACDSPCVRRVDVDVAAPGTGLTWDSALSSVQDGIDYASCTIQSCASMTSCQVWVAEGTYYIHEHDECDAVRLRSGVELYGGFAGNESTLTERDPVMHATVLDGHEGPAETAQVLHVVYGWNDTSIDGFEITGGNAERAGQPIGNGGGIWVSGSSSFAVRNCTLRGNSAPTSGGGIYAVGVTVEISSCEFIDNQSREGSAAFLQVARATIRDSLFSSNGGNPGQPLRIHRSTATIDGCLFSRNPGGGVGVVGAGASATITDCAFSGNSRGAVGAGSGARVEVVNSRFIDLPTGRGAAIGVGGSSAALPASQVEDESSVEVRSCLFHHSPDGWSVSSTINVGTGCRERCGPDDCWNEVGPYGVLSVTNSTFASGSAPVTAIYIDGPDIAGDMCLVPNQSMTVVQVENSIFSGEDLTDIEQDDFDPREVVYRYNILDPDFVDPDNGDFRLPPGSPCIDAGDGRIAPSTDIDGNPRVDDPVSDNTGVGPPWVDIGAYEYQP